MTKKTINDIYRFLGTARMGKMKEDEKIAVIKLLRSMKPVATELQNAATDALEKARAEYPDDMQRVMQIVDKSMEDLANEEVDIIDTNILSAETFERLCLSNDWTFAQIDELEALLTRPNQ